MSLPFMAEINWGKLNDPGTLLRVAVLVGVGWPLVLIAANAIGRISRKSLSAQACMLLSKAVRYGGTVLVLLMALQQLDFKLGVLLGTAGVVGVALGFASQTSVSNFISGLFLVFERPFEIGDVIQVDQTTGEVMSIDLLSVKLRTFDNRYVRLPNENLIKTQVETLTHYPIRRLDIRVGVAYKEDVTRVKAVLTDIARNHPQVLDEPEPLIFLEDFGDSALVFFFACWCVREDFLLLKKTLRDQIKDRFDVEGIEIPFPHLTLYAGSQTDPHPVRLVSTAPPTGSSAARSEEVTGE